jgi:hypothetical protein
LIIALVAAGCGSSGSGGSDTSASISKPQFVKQANAICKKSQQEREAAVNKVAEEIKPGANAGDLPPEKLIGTVIPLLADMVDELAALPAPKGDEDQVEAMIEAYEEQVEELEADPNGAFTGETFKQADEEALKYGLEDCVL